MNNAVMARYHIKDFDAIIARTPKFIAAVYKLIPMVAIVLCMFLGFALLVLSLIELKETSPYFVIKSNVDFNQVVFSVVLIFFSVVCSTLMNIISAKYTKSTNSEETEEFEKCGAELEAILDIITKTSSTHLEGSEYLKYVPIVIEHASLLAIVVSEKKQWKQMLQTDVDSEGIKKFAQTLLEATEKRQKKFNFLTNPALRIFIGKENEKEVKIFSVVSESHKGIHCLQNIVISGHNSIFFQYDCLSYSIDVAIFFSLNGKKMCLLSLKDSSSVIDIRPFWLIDSKHEAYSSILLECTNSTVANSKDSLMFIENFLKHGVENEL